VHAASRRGASLYSHHHGVRFKPQFLLHNCNASTSTLMSAFELILMSAVGLAQMTTLPKRHEFKRPHRSFARGDL